MIYEGYAYAIKILNHLNHLNLELYWVWNQYGLLVCASFGRGVQTLVCIRSAQDNRGLSPTGGTCHHGHCASKDFDVVDGGCLAPFGRTDLSNADYDFAHSGASEWQMRSTTWRWKWLGNCICYRDQSYHRGATRELHLDFGSCRHLDSFSLSDHGATSWDVVANEVRLDSCIFPGAFRGVVLGSNTRTAGFGNHHKSWHNLGGCKRDSRRTWYPPPLCEYIFLGIIFPRGRISDLPMLPLEGCKSFGATFVSMESSGAFPGCTVGVRCFSIFDHWGASTVAHESQDPQLESAWPHSAFGSAWDDDFHCKLFIWYFGFTTPLEGSHWSPQWRYWNRYRQQTHNTNTIKIYK